MKQAKQRGNNGEQIAAEWLIKQGYKEVQRQVRVRGAEMDLIMKRGRQYVFVEVKTRRQGNAASAPHDIDPHQVRRLARFIESYVMRHGVEDWRLYLVCVVITATQPIITSIDLTDSLDLG